MDISEVSNGTEPSMEVGYFMAAIFLLFIPIGLLLNVMVIGIILKLKLYSQPSVMLMLNLAIACLLVCLCLMPLTLILGIGNVIGAVYYYEVCKSSFFFTFLPLTSALTVALMSVDRAIYLKKPLTYKLIVTPLRMLAAIVVVWVFCIALSTPPLFTPIMSGFKPNIENCVLNLEGWHTMLTAVVFAIATLVQFIGCGCIVYITRTYLKTRLGRVLSFTSQSHHTRNNQRNNILKDYSKSQLHLVGVFTVIFITGILSTLVPLVMVAIASATLPLHSFLFLYATCFILYLSTSLTYPIIEVTMTHELRSVVSTLCPACVIMCTCSCKKSISSEDT